MQKNIVYLILFGVAFLSSCRHEEKKAELSLSPYVYHLGIIPENSLSYGSTIITNTGNDTLRIANIQISCGCTDVHLSKKSIAPKDTALLSFTYNTYGKFGHMKEIIILTANTDSLAYLFQIEAFVDVADSISKLDDEYVSM